MFLMENENMFRDNTLGYVLGNMKSCWEPTNNWQKLVRTEELWTFMLEKHEKYFRDNWFDVAKSYITTYHLHIYINLNINFKFNCAIKSIKIIDNRFASATVRIFNQGFNFFSINKLRLMFVEIENIIYVFI